LIQPLDCAQMFIGVSGGPFACGSYGIGIG
jgi:hypothetical protein